MVKFLNRRYALGYFSIFKQGDPPLSFSSSVIGMFMIVRQGFRPDGCALIAAFLFGVQPWFVVFIVSAFFFLGKRRLGAKMGVTSEINDSLPYYDLSDPLQALKNPVGTKLYDPAILSGSEYNVIVLGMGISR